MFSCVVRIGSLAVSCPEVWARMYGFFTLSTARPAIEGWRNLSQYGNSPYSGMNVRSTCHSSKAHGFVFNSRDISTGTSVHLSWIIDDLSQVTYVTSHLCHNQWTICPKIILWQIVQVLNKIVTNRPYNFGTYRFFFVTYRLGRTTNG